MQSEPPLLHNDTHIVCVSTWGDRSQSVTVTLNGVAFASRTRLDVANDSVTLASWREQPRIWFSGQRAPALVDAFFAPDTTSIILNFDAASTNRALETSTVTECITVLDNQTAAQLRGGALQPVTCIWPTARELVVQLPYNTFAAAGMRMGVRGGVLCDASNTVCAEPQSVTIHPDYPCDRRATSSRERCHTPNAVIQGPFTIASCPGTTLTLDASWSGNGGMLRVSHEWHARP